MHYTCTVYFKGLVDTVLVNMTGSNKILGVWVGLGLFDEASDSGLVII